MNFFPWKKYAQTLIKSEGGSNETVERLWLQLLGQFCAIERGDPQPTAKLSLWGLMTRQLGSGRVCGWAGKPCLSRRAIQPCNGKSSACPPRLPTGRCCLHGAHRHGQPSAACLNALLQTQGRRLYRGEGVCRFRLWKVDVLRGL